MRLEKYLADAGVASRRASKELIRDGRTTLDGRVVTVPGTTVDVERDEVRVNGRPVRLDRQLRYFAVHKPRGYLCTSHDPRGRRTVFELLPEQGQRLFIVGRLDRDVEGLVLLTNDGDLAFRLAHPRYEIGKTYVATVTGAATAERLKRLAAGVRVLGRMTVPASVTPLRVGEKKSRIRLVTHEGRKHQVKLMCLAVGLPVEALRRISIGPLTLADLPTGGYRPLSVAEVGTLRHAVGLQAPTRGTSPRSTR